jgi:Na+/proline symporter
MTLLTLFLYMISELSAIGQVVTLLTGLDGLPVMIVQCVVTTIYTCLYTSDPRIGTDKYANISLTALGGFKISFLTDVVQGSMVVGLIFIATITVGVKTKIDRSLIESSGLLEPSLVGWQILYILPISILTNNCFLAQYWLRTFSSKTDKDLWIGVSIATVVILCALTLVGSTGLIATWSGAFPGDPPQVGSVAFFTLLEQLPAWVVGIILVMVVSLSTSAFDSIQSAMVSTISNDLFRNRLNIWLTRGLVVLVIIPVIVLALKAPSILQIYLISNLVSCSTVPVLCLGLWRRCYWWHGFEVVVGGLGGLMTVFIFGLIYYGNAQQAGELLIVQPGLYSGDWAAFGAFVAAPVGSFIWGFGALALRLSFQFVLAKTRGHRFEALDPPVEHRVSPTDADQQESIGPKAAGQFF